MTLTTSRYVPTMAGRLGAAVLALSVLGLLAGARAHAQPETMVHVITLASVKADKQDGKWVITVVGAAPKVPVGTKVDFQITWRSQVLESFRETLDSPSQFTVTLKPKSGFATTDDLLLQTLISLKDPESGQSIQSKKVQDAIKADPVTFAPERAPWTDYHFDRTFRLTTAEDLEAELVEVRKFFEDRYLALAGLDRAVSDRVKAVQAGTEFMNKDKFESKKWRKWFDDDVVKPIVDLQKELEKTQQNPKFVPYRTPLYLLSELSNAIGKRVLAAQSDLYKEKGVELSAKEAEPEDLSTVVRRKKVTKRYLAGLVSQIQKALGTGDGGAEDDASDEEDQ